MRIRSRHVSPSASGGVRRAMLEYSKRVNAQGSLAELLASICTRGLTWKMLSQSRRKPS